MKKIKVKYCKYNNTDEKDPGTFSFFIHTILKKYFDVEISDDPDYIFYHEATFDYLKYDCIRIFYTGENVTPNFNFCDYAVAFDWMSFGDRYYRLPLYLVTSFYHKDEIQLTGNDFLTKKYSFSKDDLMSKTGFCSFIYSNYLADDTRKIFFEKLSSYKKVNAGGAYLNNIGQKVANKLEFESKHKFSIAFENTSRTGYTTEKIVGALVAQTIPIYWGNPDIGKEFNEKRFINCHAYSNFDEVIERVKEIDNDDGLYLSIINEPLTVQSYDFKKTVGDFENFLRHIFNQPLGEAKRRTQHSVRISNLEAHERYVSKHVKRLTILRKFLAAIYRPFKKLAFFENIKHGYFKRTKRI